jgi:hypothetical protein
MLALPTLVPATADIRFCTVATGTWHSLALTVEGQVYLWTSEEEGGPDVPTLFQELQGHRVRRVAAGSSHSAAITDRGELFTWCDDESTFEEDGVMGLEYPDSEIPWCRCPRRVETLDSVRIVSVATGLDMTLAVTDTGEWHSRGACRACSVRPNPCQLPLQHSGPCRRRPVGLSLGSPLFHARSFNPLPSFSPSLPCGSSGPWLCKFSERTGRVAPGSGAS